jgi:4'-phosphopantetheinyl transferase
MTSPLTPDAVHIWIADLRRADAVPEVLSAAERARSRKAGPLWARSREILRRLLAEYIEHEQPGELRFALGPHGKPTLVGGGPSFNLSHSGHLALYAIAHGRELGVDLELIRPLRAERGLAKRLLGEHEARALAELTPHERTRALLVAWVRREALGKCHGAGVAHAPASESAARVEVVELQLGVDLVGALASDPPGDELCSYRWPARAQLP